MEKILLPSDIILDDPRFLEIGVEDFTPGDAAPAGGRAHLDVQRGVQRLLEDQQLGARFLYAVSRGSGIYWAGDHAAEATPRRGETLGVKVIRRRDGDVLAGGNVYGEYLERVRDAYVEALRTSVVPEEPVREGQVIVDFTQRGSYRSEVELREQDGEQFIHVDPYVPSRFRFDAGRDGTTGHASREADSEVRFHRFTCPFGTGYPYPVVVGSEAEASFLFERALRGELDWKGTFDDLSRRGLLDRKLSDRQKEALASELGAQFDWMREQVCSDPSLRRRRIVAGSALASDASLGRSVFDAEAAPSPAHVLARYINNPTLFFSPSENGVLRALSTARRDEPERFRLEGDKESVTVLVIGSDTIGGREPGRRATSKRVLSEEMDAEGRKVLSSSKSFSIPRKDREEVEADYAAFSARLDSILSGIPEGVKVRLVTGGTSPQGTAVGIGTPLMVERYVRERGGGEYRWNFSRNGEGQRRDFSDDAVEGVAKRDVEVVLMDHFGECLPVLAGAKRSVEFLLEDGIEETQVRFEPGGALSPDGAVCFSVSEDANNRNVLAMGSVAAGYGLPVVHVQENRSEEEQRVRLAGGAALSLAAFSGDEDFGASLFRGEPQREWPLAESNVLSLLDPDNGVAIPLLAQERRNTVVVGSMSFHSPLGAFVALTAEAAGVGSREELARVKAAEGSFRELMDLYKTFSSAEGYTPEVQERCMRRSVRLFAGGDSSFRELLLALDERPVVLESHIPSDLFAGLDGQGENRFGVVLAAEAAAQKAILDARRAQEEEDLKAVNAENARRQKLAIDRRAECQKVSNGLPGSIAEAGGAVWFLGTNGPGALSIDDGSHSFEMWDDMRGTEPLNRDVAMASELSDGAGGKLENRFVFLFASDLEAVTGKRKVFNRADSADLTGCVRTDPKTGVSFPCAFGVPVRVNNRGYEFFNDYGMPCSYRLDGEASKFVDSLILADSAARSTALRHGQSLCLLGRMTDANKAYYPLGSVFMDKTWSRRENGWVDNPHKAPLNAAAVRRYIDVLEAGRSYPLNCIPLARPFYTPGRDGEAQFITDLLFSLKMANAAAMAIGVPLRFPLDREGRYDLGPGVPEELRRVAEQRIDSFIGVKRAEDLSAGDVQALGRISMMKALDVKGGLTRAGEDLYLRPNDLVAAFGRYDFSMIERGQVAPLHEMAFRSEDGTVLILTDAKLTKGMASSDIEPYLKYEKNDVRRFMVRCSDPEKAAGLVRSVKEYVARAKGVTVETRLVQDSALGAGDDRSLEGFVNLLESNGNEFVRTRHDIGAEMDVFNGESRFDGTDAGSEYFGKVAAKDSFAGYAEMRYTLPDGTQSGWRTVTDLDLAKQVVLDTVDRKYRFRKLNVEQVSSQTLDMMLKAYAVADAGQDLFRGALPGAAQKVDDKVVTLDMEGLRSQGQDVNPEPERSAPAEVSVPEVSARPGEVEFTVSKGGYSRRTYENAQADDVDFTFAFAVDFSTAGEKCTAKAAGNSLVEIPMQVVRGGGLDLSQKAVNAAVKAVEERLPDEFLQGEPFGVNVAGNGLYTLVAKGVSQEQTDEFVTRVLDALRRKGAVISSVRSGGQTGVDEAGIAAAQALGIPAAVHAPKGWLLRTAQGVDVSGEEAFKERFSNKDIASLRSRLSGRRAPAVRTAAEQQQKKIG